MQNVLYVEVSIVGICLLLIILFNQRQNIGASTLQRQFNLLVYTTMAMLVVDAACWLLDGTTFPHARALNIAIETVYFMLNILVPYCWVAYLEFALNKKDKITYRRLRILAIPLVLLIVLLFVNLHTQSVFIIDENNVYHRNSGFYAFAVLAYVYLAYASGRALFAARHAAWNEDRRRFYPMAAFMVLPAVGGIIQTFFYGVTLIWVFVAVTIMLLYIETLKRQVSTDPLTGINNRRELTKYLQHETRDPSHDGLLALIMMDVDHFKQANDTYGHLFGDSVLVTVSTILKDACKNSAAFLARYGGDEFCIVYPVRDVSRVEALITSIRETIADSNERRNDPFLVSLSIGYAVWDPGVDDTLDDLYRRADMQMYRDKKEKRMKLVS